MKNTTFIAIISCIILLSGCSKDDSDGRSDLDKLQYAIIDGIAYKVYWEGKNEDHPEAWCKVDFEREDYLKYRICFPGTFSGFDKSGQGEFLLKSGEVVDPVLLNNHFYYSFDRNGYLIVNATWGEHNTTYYCTPVKGTWDWHNDSFYLHQ